MAGPAFLDADWRYLREFFPADLDDIAKSTGAVVRWRNIKNGEELLRLCLTYAVEDFSLRTTAGWAARSQWVELKDTSVLHRLRKATPFLEVVLAHLLNHRLGADRAAGRPLRLVDATVLSIPGSVGTDWRIHAIYEPVSCRLVRVQVTDHTGSERLDRYIIEAGDVVVADRGLAHARGIHAVNDANAYCLLRMHWQNIKLESTDGSPLVLNELLEKANRGMTGTDIRVPLKGREAVPVRLLIRPLPPDKAEEARAKMRRNASKKCRKPSERGLLLAGYFCLLTSIPEEVASDDAVMEYYRVRWQVELFFKRCKSLLKLNSLRAVDPNLVRAYCTGKLIEIALVELLASEGEAFSPWGVPRRRHRASQPLASGTHA